MDMDFLMAPWCHRQASTLLIPINMSLRERQSVRMVEMRPSAVFGVIGEFECLSEKDTEEACFTLYSQ